MAIWISVHRSGTAASLHHLHANATTISEKRVGRRVKICTKISLGREGLIGKGGVLYQVYCCGKRG